MKVNIKATNLDLTPAIRQYIEIKIGSLEHFLKRFDGSTLLTINPESIRLRSGLSSERNRRTERRRRIEEKNEIEVFVEIARTTRHHKSGNIFYAEANLHLPKQILRAEHSDWNIRVAIDKVKDKLKQEIKKYKETKV